MMLHLVIITIITLLLLSGSILSVVQADIIITLPWCKPAAAATATAGDDATTTTTINYYEPRQARVGDEIIFQWSHTGNYHNVFLYPNGGGDDCTDTTAEKVFISEQSGASYIFQPADIGTNLTFVCSVSGHCRMGQYVTFFDILPEFTTATTTAAIAANNDTTTGDDTNNDNATIDYILSTPCGFDGLLQRSNDDETILPTFSSSSSSADNNMMTGGDGGGGGSGGIAGTMCTILLLQCAVVAAVTMII